MRIRSSEDENDGIMTVSEVLEQLTEDSDPNLFTGESIMATKKTKAAAAPEETTKTKKTKAAKPEAKATEKAKGTFGPRQLPDGYVGVAKLAEDSKLAPAIVRRKLRGLEGIEKGEHGWAWKEGSKDYAKVLKALTAEPAEA